MQGTLKTVFRNNGFGFIESGRLEYFFHKSNFDGHWEDLCDDYEKNVQVELSFVEVQGERGPRAEEVRVLRTV
jgi:cold shock CspA family protein